MRLRNGTVATALIFITSFMSLSWYTTWQNGKEKLIAYQREFHALKQRLRAAEHRTLQRSSELNTILEQFRRAIAETNGSKDALGHFSDETQKLLKELAHRKPLQVPNIYYHLPHLLNNEGSLQPAVQVGLGRTKVSIVMGIPTVKRKVKSYLAETLHSLINKLSPEEKLDCVIIVFVGEADIDYVRSVVESLEKEFSTEISSGLLEVISPPASYYPDLTNLKETFGDTKERVKWRTKQNLDYSFLMMYALNKGTYYVQKHCERQKSNLRVRFRPSLFQHVGLHSSLAGKIQKLTDKDFLKPLLHKIHVNPPAEVSTSLKMYQGHTLEKTYLGEDFFWAITPTAGDYILFKFDRPVNIERYLFRSGNPEHPGDKLQNTTVEILPFSETGLKTKDKYKRTDDGFYRIGKFENGVSESAVDPVFNPISALRLSVLQDSAVWAILSEMHIKKAAR
ncbi:alpha-1,3-mannosyl-glycoprotein 4-beta-N-acetylglucosaminyltransferase A isoform X3 [Acipenser ruthenus]|uniref:alpha-1,3-mannosyl-glycoprotein 4-beta-N-acetylglucosaminyltransferase A isoform X3 n=1 Tax=Acipenser ruthenus TaxID=7906 RepID=UPI00274206CD|nr:alpha-1,3-mannosyl-glycoprotein 4-beta-N-acetylglucosaminyltransferase A isoform X3 [Acipenser ruthenus]